ncbi:MAG TPA: lamin tail domain-containing protein [Acidimicrobiia bacterium]
MPRRATAVVLSLLAACSAPGGVEEPPVVTVASDEHSVVSVIDGDTIVVGSGGLEERVRLIGINAPEPEECLAEEATQALDDLVSGSPVRLVPDASDRDGFGRLLRYVYVDGEFVNEALVRRGLAIAHRYEPNVANQEILETAEAEARAEGAGMWSPDACPSEYELRIGDFNYDAAGPDDENLNDEWIELVNPGTDTVRLDGWVLKDESASNRYQFPAEAEIPPGGSMIVRSGCGTDTSNELFWCADRSVWTNGGDTAFLLDPEGNIADYRSYP